MQVIVRGRDRDDEGIFIEFLVSTINFEIFKSNKFIDEIVRTINYLANLAIPFGIFANRGIVQINSAHFGEIPVNSATTHLVSIRFSALRTQRNSVENVVHKMIINYKI